jgi:hypothetical protein
MESYAMLDCDPGVWRWAVKQSRFEFRGRAASKGARKMKYRKLGNTGVIVAKILHPERYAAGGTS